MRMAAALTGAALAVSAFCGAAQADPMPLPRADYAATVKMADLPDPITVRYHGGLFRLEFNTEGQTQIVLIDPKTQVATVLEKTGGKKTAMEMPAGPFNIPQPGKDVGAKKVGTDQVNGEACDLWRHPNPEINLASDTCVARDGIWLRVTRPDYDEPMSLITRLERKAQDPALFAVPAGYTKIAPTTTP